MSIALSTTLRTSFDDAVARTRDALAAQGFGVLTEIDMKATLSKKLGESAGDELGDYLILGACNPPLAQRAVTIDRQIGLLLPCNVIVHELDSDEVEVAAIDPLSSMVAVGNESLAELGREVRAKLGRVIEAIERAGSRVQAG